MNIIPKPNYYKIDKDLFILGHQSTINYSSELANEANYFIKYVKEEINHTLEVSFFSNINFTLDFNLDEEGYNIIINPTNIELSARTSRGAFYGVQTLIQLFRNKKTHLQSPCLHIKDQPRFIYRGFMIDVARHFFNKEVIFNLIDIISFHKFNTLHLHLTDDQGWRIESEKYPLLTKIGSARKHTSLKLNPNDNVPHYGFYTKQDLKDIVQYAKTKHIEVIPEIDIPGHTNSLIAAYPNLSCTQELIDVRNTFGISSTILCAGNKDVYTMIEDLLEEVITIFKPKYIHLGGDEAPKKNWKKCLHCQQKIKENNLKNVQELQTYFFNYFANFLRERNITPIGWNDCLNEKLNYNVIIQHWKPFSNKKTVKAINQERKTIISNFFSLYLDYPYSLTPLEKTYKFNPVLKGVYNTNHILGIEAPLWTEWVESVSKLEFQILPRLSAVSELAWTNEENLNYDNFLERLKEFEKYYHKNNLTFANNITKRKTLLKRIFSTYQWIKDKDIEYNKN